MRIGRAEKKRTGEATNFIVEEIAIPCLESNAAAQKQGWGVGVHILRAGRPAGLSFSGILRMRVL